MANGGASGASKVWMIVALVAMIALIVSIATRPSAPAPEVQTGPPGADGAKSKGAADAGTRAPEAPEAPPIVPDRAPPADAGMGLAVPVPEGVSPSYPPSSVSPTVPPVTQKDRGEEGMRYALRGVQDVAHLVQVRVEEIGREKLSRYLDATWTGVTTETGNPVATVISAGSDGSMRIAYPQAHIAHGLHRGRCWELHDGAALDCLTLDEARTRLYRGVHDATLLLPLSGKPYKLRSALMLRPAESLHRPNTHNHTYSIAGTDLELTVAQDPDDLTLRSVRLRSKRLSQMGIDALAADLGGWVDFDDVPFPTLWQVRWELGEASAVEVKKQSAGYTVHISNVVPGAPATARTLRPERLPGRVRVTPRRALMVIREHLAAGESPWHAWFGVRERLPPHRLTLPQEFIEAFAEGGDALALVDLLSPSRTMTDKDFAAIPASPAVARKLVSIPLSAVPSALSSFAGELARKGHEVVAGMKLARVLRWPPMPEKGMTPTPGPCTVELQLPVRPK